MRVSSSSSSLLPTLLPSRVSCRLSYHVVISDIDKDIVVVIIYEYDDTKDVTVLPCFVIVIITRNHNVSTTTCSNMCGGKLYAWKKLGRKCIVNKKSIYVKA